MVDYATMPDEAPDFVGESLDQSTEYHVITTLRELGHEVSVLGVNDRVRPILDGLTEQQPDLVFNLTEQFRDRRRLDKNIAGLLEMLGVPFTGAGSAGMLLCRNKGLCKQVLGAHKIRVPGFAIFPPGKRVRVRKALKFPLVVKPLYEDGSEGISNASLVRDEPELGERASLIHERWKQPAIAEEYIAGRELYMGVLGNQRLTVLPPRELFFGNGDPGGPVLATYKVKWDKEYQERWKISFGFGELDADTFKKVARTCKRVYRLLQLQDFGRMDLRLTPEGQIAILEANPNPDIAYGEEVAEAAEKVGISYGELLDRIVRLALRRYGR